MPDRHRDDDRRLHRPAVGALPGHPRPRVGGHGRRGRGGRASPSTVGDRVVCEGFDRLPSLPAAAAAARRTGASASRRSGSRGRAATPSSSRCPSRSCTACPSTSPSTPASSSSRRRSSCAASRRRARRPGEAVGVIGVGTLGALAIALLRAALAVADRRLRRPRGGARARAAARRHRGRPRGRRRAGAGRARPRRRDRGRARRGRARDAALPARAAGPCCSGSPARDAR